MNTTIFDRGEFVLAISALAAGDFDTITQQAWPSQGKAHDVLTFLWEALRALEPYEFHSAGLKGKSWLLHPSLGTLEWELTGTGSGEVRQLLIRLNGKQILRTGFRDDVLWLS